MTAEEPRYIEVAILTHPDAADGLFDVLQSLGARGVAEERGHVNVTVTAYLTADDKTEEKAGAVRARLAALERQGIRIGPGTIAVRTVEPTDWREVWREHFEVLKIAPGLVVAPSWERYEPEPGESVLVLDPGAAFGTGGHATTRLCLRALLAHLRPGDRVADIGCGSGILAIAAAALGAREVVATDNDSSALLVARANAAKNSVTSRIRFAEADLLPTASDPFDLIVCNIVAEEIARLAERFPGLLARGGRFIGSGFLTGTVPAVEDALARGGLQMVETIGEEGWAACIAARPDRTR